MFHSKTEKKIFLQKNITRNQTFQSDETKDELQQIGGRRNKLVVNE